MFYGESFQFPSFQSATPTDFPLPSMQGFVPWFGIWTFAWDELFACYDDVGAMTPEGDAFDILGEERVSKWQPQT